MVRMIMTMLLMMMVMVVTMVKMMMVVVMVMMMCTSLKPDLPTSRISAAYRMRSGGRL